jgi:hypothetical protein
LGLLVSLVLDLACWCLQNSDPELSAIYCGSWQFGRVSQSFLGFRRLQFLRLQLQVLRRWLRLQVSRLRLRVWRRDVPPGSCCASVAQGPDGGQSTARSGSSTAAPASAATVCCGAGERRDSVLLLRLVALATPHSLCSSPRPSPPPRTVRAPASCGQGLKRPPRPGHGDLGVERLN